MKEKELSFQNIKNVLQSNNILVSEEIEKIKLDLENLFELEVIPIPLPYIMIDDNGMVLNTEEEFSSRGYKTLTAKTMYLKTLESFKLINSHPCIYVYSARLIEGGISICFAGYNLSKKKVTFTISEDIMNDFDNLANKLAINKSKFIENKIKEFVSNTKV